MNSRRRTLDHIAGAAVDRLPFHPIVMRIAARLAGAKYSDFCLKPEVKCSAMISFAQDFGADWVTVMSDPYAESEALGMEIEYPVDDLPKPKALLLKTVSDIGKLKVQPVEGRRRLLGRVEEIRIFRRLLGDSMFVVGWVEGPLAEYVDLRGMENTFLDLYDHPAELDRACDILLENAMRFADAQIAAGADCVGVGDAAASQIGPGLYLEHVFPRELALVKRIHDKGALAKLHICGNIRAILPDVIRTGADIIDIDHLVGSMAPFRGLLGGGQVFSGRSDPVTVIQNGTPAKIAADVRDCIAEAGGRLVVSAGCEVTPDTGRENLLAWRDCAAKGIRQGP